MQPRVVIRGPELQPIDQSLASEFPSKPSDFLPDSKDELLEDLSRGTPNRETSMPLGLKYENSESPAPGRRLGSSSNAKSVAAGTSAMFYGSIAHYEGDRLDRHGSSHSIRVLDLQGQTNDRAAGSSGTNGAKAVGENEQDYEDADEEDGADDDSEDGDVANEDDEITDRDAGGIWTHDEPFVDSLAGTLHFLAPECLERQGSSKSDYWSLGVLIFRLCTGTFPFKHGTQGELLHRIRRGYIRWHKLPQSLPYRLLDLIRGLLERDPNKRYGGEQLRRHPFLQDKTYNQMPLSEQLLFSTPGPMRMPWQQLISRTGSIPSFRDDRHAINTIRHVRLQLRA